MENINIYKIQNEKFDSLKESLIDKNYSNMGKKLIEIDVLSGELNGEKEKENAKESYKMTFLMDNTNYEKNLSWKWILELFDITPPIMDSSPKAVIIIKKNEEFYAITFGHSYYHPNIYCDRNWPLEYAKRLNYRNIKKTSVVIPNSQKNQIISGFINYDSLDLSSGEGLTNLNARVKLFDGVDFIGENLSIGNSLKFEIVENNLETIAQIINHVEHTISTKKIIHDIPYLKEISDKDKIRDLNLDVVKKLLDDINMPKEEYDIDISTYFLYGTDIIFLNENSKYYVKYKYGKEKEISNINILLIHEFIKEKKLTINDDILNNVKIKIVNENEKDISMKLSQLIFYNNDEDNFVLFDGKWSKYNIDYEKYLKKSLDEIDVIYDKELNYDETKYSGEGKGEHRYIKFLENDYGYENVHTSLSEVIKNHKLEAMDLYKDKSMFTVKFGNSASKLSYAVDQSLLGLKAIHDGKLDLGKEIGRVCLWLVHTTKTRELPVKNGKPDINGLKMFILKNRIDQWKKEVRYLGYTPIIRINYSKKNIKVE